MTSMTAMAGIPLSWVNKYCAEVHLSLLERDSLFNYCDFHPKFDDDRDTVSSATWFALHFAQIVSSEDELLGLADRPLRRGTIVLLLQLMLGSQNLMHALESAESMLRLMGCPTLKHLHVADDHAVLRCDAPGEAGSAAGMVEDISLNFIVAVSSWLIDRPLPVRSVTVRDPRHPNIGGLHWGIGAPVLHGDTTSVVLPKSVLMAPIVARKGEDCVRDWVGFWLDMVENGWSRNETDAVRMTAGTRLSDLSRGAGLSNSTMRRRLQEEGRGFRQSRQDALCDAGLELLRSTDASVDSIALELGYADARNFRRFMKNALGVTPNDVRNGVTISRPIATTSQKERQIVLDLASQVNSFGPARNRQPTGSIPFCNDDGRPRFDPPTGITAPTAQPN